LGFPKVWQECRAPASELVVAVASLDAFSNQLLLVVLLDISRALRKAFRHNSNPDPALTEWQKKP